MLLDAPFAAVTQIIVYAGAIMVLFLFVVMLLNVPREDAAEWDRIASAAAARRVRFGTALAVAAGRGAGHGPSGTISSVSGGAVRDGAGSVASVPRSAASIFSDYAFPFEATSVLILVAMVGAVMLARRGQGLE